MSLFRSSAIRLIKNVVLQSNATKQINVESIRYIKRWVAPTLAELKRRRDKLGPEPPQPRSSYLEWNYDAEVFAFGKRLGEDFDSKLLRQALLHKSYTYKQSEIANEDNLELNDNFELIKAGEKFIADYINEELGKKYPNDVVKAAECYLMSDDMLAHVAVHMGLKDIVLTTEFPVENETLANTFKAVVAALQRSSGDERTERFVKDFLLSHLTDKDIYEIWDLKYPYEYLQSLLKQRGINDVEPRLCNESASNTILANYQVGLYSNKQLLGIGWGESVEIAKDTAALDAIKRLYEGNVRE